MKIFQLLSTLSKEELKLLRKAVLSPIYNTNQKVVCLFDILRQLHPHYDASSKSQHKIYKKLFPGEVFKESKLQWHFTKLTKVIECLLVHIALEKDTIGRQKKLIKIYRERNLATLFFNKNKHLKAELEMKPTPNATLHLHKYQLGSSQYFHLLHDKYNREDSTLPQAIQDLDCFFILEKLRLGIALKSREQVLQEQHQLYLIDNIKKGEMMAICKKNPLLQLYWMAFQLSKNSAEVEFDLFETTLFEQLDTFETTDLQFLFFAGLNYVVKQRNEGLENSGKKLLKWYQFGLSSELLFINGKMTESVFANMVICGCRNNAFDWTRTFIEKYGQIVITDNLAETLQYYHGLVYYIQGDLDQSLDYLIMSNKKSVFPPRKQAILIRALFEKYLIDFTYKDLLLANLRSFKTVLKNNKNFSQERLQPYIHFIDIIQHLAKKIDKKESSLSIKQWLAAKTANHLPVLAKRWIFEKVANL